MVDPYLSGSVSEYELLLKVFPKQYEIFQKLHKRQVENEKKRNILEIKFLEFLLYV